jgi:hypothetical protein
MLATLLAVALVGAAAPPALAAGDTATYEITITNLTESQWFTPPAAATHRPSFDAFSVGRRASEGVKEIAENGNLAPFTALLDAHGGVQDWTVAVADPNMPPLGPGQSVTFTLEADRGTRRLSYVAMLICTNDGFTGADGLRLPRNVGQSTTTYGVAYDAGTEVNTEAWEDLVPPCAQLTGFGDQGGTGVSNPALAEGGVVSMHAGILGVADLVTDVHGWSNPVSMIEVIRLG